ncbi:MAG: phage antirepressor protein, partial [Candidatus Diapherotrites archaeon]|nr:phage antirepressor protein [Candidatus Diapherotrites archaeon]
IEKRMRAIAIRGELTDEWKTRGVQEGKEYSILTAEIAKATFGVTPTEHQKLKRLDKVKTGNNLRDHMTDLELIFTMLGEASTTKIAKSKDAQGFVQNQKAARLGGKIAGDARKKLEVESGEKIVTTENYLQEPETSKRKKRIGGKIA